MKLPDIIVALTVTAACCFSSVVAGGQDIVNSKTEFDRALRRFGVDHNRPALRAECDRAIAGDPRFGLPVFFLGVLDEADENWLLALTHFHEFLALEGDSVLGAKARREIAKLPFLIKEDSTPSGKHDRQYRQRLGYAELLQRDGFSREAFLEAAEASKLLPNRWEAYAVASDILLSQHDLAGATHFLELARKNVPDDSVQKLKGLIEQINHQSAIKGSSSVQH